MNKKEIKKALNQLGRVRKNPALDPIDRKKIETIRKKLYAKSKGVKKMFQVENLYFVHFDEATGIYTLEFHKDGNRAFLEVNASDHPEAATDEYYFDDPKVIEKIISEK